MRALLATTLLWATPLFADVGVLTTVVEGFDNQSAEDRRKQLDANVAHALGPSYLALELAAGCQINGDAVATSSAPLPTCIAAATAGRPEIDEVAQVMLRRLGPRLTEMTLRIFDRDGVAQTQLRAEIGDAESVRATRGLLRKAFDPSRFRGVVHIKGTPNGAQLVVDGLSLETPRAPLRVGKHLLQVMHEDGRVETVPFEVSFERITEVLVPSIATPTEKSAGAPFWVATGTGVAGILAATGGLILYLVDKSEQKKWGDHAPDKEVLLAAAEDPRKGRWAEGYGPEGSPKTVSQGAAFMMVALREQGWESWETGAWGAYGLGIAGALAIVSGTVGFVSFFFPRVDDGVPAE